MTKGAAAFHTRLRTLRTDRGISRQDLAKSVGVHYQTIGYIERAEYSPSLEVALQIAQVFQLPVDAIFSLDPFPPLGAAALAATPD
jgi:putative transcriptional regulator